MIGRSQPGEEQEGSIPGQGDSLCAGLEIGMCSVSEGQREGKQAGAQGGRVW